MLTIFANMLINSEERFEHLKDSFASFDTVSDDWLINVRGKERDRVIAFLKERLGDKATFFELLDDDRGWSRNSLDMLKHAKHPYVFIWIEDHMNIASQGYMRSVAEEMAEHDADYLQYSWWQNGKYREKFKKFTHHEGHAIDSVLLEGDAWENHTQSDKQTPLVSLLGIFHREFLTNILKRDLYMFPLPFTRFVFKCMTALQRLGLRFNQKEWFLRINRLSGYRFRKFSTKAAPHDVEKPYYRFEILPFRTAILHQEMFACMDDDDDPSDPYSLMTRGMYPIRNRLISWDPGVPLWKHVSGTTQLAADAAIREAYCYYSAKGVRHVLSREYVKVLKGRIRISVKNETIELVEGEGAAFFTNIPHEILGLEDSEIERFTPDLGLAPHHLAT